MGPIVLGGMLIFLADRAREVLRACLVNNRVRLGGAKSASFLPTTASYEPFLRVDPSIFEAFLPKRAIGDRLSACAPEPQEGSTLTFTKQALSFYRDFIASVPDEVGGGCAFVTAPPSCSYPSPCWGLRSGLHPRAQSKLEHLS